MTCKDCIHSGLCYKENDYDNFPNKCGDFEGLMEIKERIKEKIEYELLCMDHTSSSEKRLHSAQVIECLTNAYMNIDAVELGQRFDALHDNLTVKMKGGETNDK